MSDKPCKLHVGTTNEKGYGRITKNGVSWLAHRYSYAQHHGLSRQDLIGVVIRHRCDTPRCIEPTHLVAGTHKDNMRDMVERGRSYKHRKWSILTDATADYILDVYVKGCPVYGVKGLASTLMVSASTVRNVVKGRWNTLTKPTG